MKVVPEFFKIWVIVQALWLAVWVVNETEWLSLKFILFGLWDLRVQQLWIYVILIRRFV